MTRLNKILGALVLMFCFSACEIIAPVLGVGGSVLPVSNPFYQLAEVKLVGCYGNSSAATVELHFIVTAHSNLITKGSFGQYPNSKFVAQGKAYTSITSASVELVRYQPTTVVVKVSQIPDYLTRFDRIELQWYFNPSNHSGTSSMLQFNFVPIVWR